jgi:hypothetical protein
VLGVYQPIARLEARVTELEPQRLRQPPKTPGNSSVPPSADQKPTCARGVIDPFLAEQGMGSGARRPPRPKSGSPQSSPNSV